MVSTSRDATESTGGISDIVSTFVTETVESTGMTESVGVGSGTTWSASPCCMLAKRREGSSAITNMKTKSSTNMRVFLLTAAKVRISGNNTK